MKKLQAMLIAITFLITSGYAQIATTDTKKTPATYLDIMINVVSTNLNYGNNNKVIGDYTKSNKGIQAGLSFQAGISSWFSLVPELYYMRKGGRLTEGNPLTHSASKLNIHTFELPNLARFHLGKLYLNAGPSVSYAFGGRNKTDGQSIKLSFSKSAEGFRHVEAAVQMGGGFAFPFRQKRLALDIRYNQ